MHFHVHGVPCFTILPVPDMLFCVLPFWIICSVFRIPDLLFCVLCLAIPVFHISLQPWKHFFMKNFMWKIYMNCNFADFTEGPWCVFSTTRHQVYWGLTRGFLMVLWFDITCTRWKTQRYAAHSGASRLKDPYKYIFTAPVMCSQ